MEEKQKEGMSSLRLIVSISTTFAIVGKLPKVESQLLTRGLFNLFTI